MLEGAAAALLAALLQPAISARHAANDKIGEGVPFFPWLLPSFSLSSSSACGLLEWGSVHPWVLKRRPQLRLEETSGGDGVCAPAAAQVV